MQKRIKAEKKRNEEARRKAEDQSATKIQQIMRGKMARREFAGKLMKRERLIREKLFNKSAYCIQSAWWLSRHRTRVRHIRLRMLRRWMAIATFLSHTRLFLIHKRHQHRERSALTIQLAIRCYWARKAAAGFRTDREERTILVTEERTLRMQTSTGERSEFVVFKELFSSLPIYKTIRQLVHDRRISATTKIEETYAEKLAVVYLPTPPPKPVSPSPTRSRRCYGSCGLKYWFVLVQNLSPVFAHLESEIEELLFKEITYRIKITSELANLHPYFKSKIQFKPIPTITSPVVGGILSPYAVCSG